MLIKANNFLMLIRLQKAELEDNLAKEEEIEKSWQLEYEEISKFSQSSDEKYAAYIQVH